MNKIKLHFLLLFNCLWCCCWQNVNAQTNHRPNVLLILADDMGWGDVRSHGNQQIDTPHLDQLASAGARFDRFFVSPLCAPTRASLLTGRYHLRTGVSGVSAGRETMRTNETTLAEVFKQAGYQTGVFGKWHNGAHFPENPKGQGFDEFLGFCGGHWTNYFDTQLQHNDKMVKTKGYITDVLTDAALQYIDKQRTKPFFCYVPYNAPHGPFQVPNAYFEKYKARGFDNREAAIMGMVDNLDQNVGRLLRKLNDLQLSDNTIVIFLTDNGPNSTRYNGGMKGTKGSVHEGGTRVPLFVRWPKKIKPTTTITSIAAHIDILPTLVELTGVKMPQTLPLDGQSVASFLLRKPTNTTPERTIFSHVFKSKTSQTVTPFEGNARTQRYRYTRDEKSEELYDMLADPEQKTNISTQQPAVFEQLRHAYNDWFKDVTRTEPTPEVTQIGHAAAPIVELYAPDASKKSTVNYFGQNGWAHDWFKGFQTSQEMAVWEIEAVKTGEYEVSVSYNAPPSCVGKRVQIEVGGQKVEATVQKAYVGTPIKSPNRFAAIEVPEKEWATLRVGYIKMDKGRNTILFRLLDSPSDPFEVKSLLIKK